MAIQYKKWSTNELVDKEDWYWIAYYNDGTKLEQFAIEDRGPTFHNSSEIDTTKLVSLELKNNIFPSVEIDYPSDPNASVVFFYRRTTAQDFLHGQNPSDATLVRERKYKRTYIGFRIKTYYWLACVDDYNHLIFTSNKNLFVEEN